MVALLSLLRERVTTAIAAAFGPDVILPAPPVVPATNPKFGDYQINIALSLSKPLGKNPRAIATEILNHLDLGEMVELPEIAGPGFINLRLRSAYLGEVVQSLRSGDRLGIPPVPQPQRVIVDFSSPNIAKEMHVGHLRSTIIGDCIARILEFRGHEVLRLNHVGDWGTQFGMLITYLREAYPQALTQADALDIGDLVTFYKQAKVRFDEDPDFKEASRLGVVALQGGDRESLQAWQLLCDQSRREFQQIYDRLGVRLTERGESFYNPFLGEVVAHLKAQGLLQEDQGAQCVFLEGFLNKEGQPQPLIVRKSDGGYNYATTDLAALRYRVNEDRAQRIIYVTDSGQANHFAQVFQVARRSQLLPETVEVVHVPFGLVQGEDGKKLKTRAGDTVKLKDLLDEAVAIAHQDLSQRLTEEDRQETAEFIDQVARTVGYGAVKYADLSQNRTSNYIFSYNKMLTLQGNTAPYMIYAYVRVQGIARQGQIDLDNLGEAAILLQEETEKTLALHLVQFEEILEEVERELLPNRLCDYLYDLSRKFNKFYEECPILRAEAAIRTSRLILAHLTARTLQRGLDLLGIAVLERI